MSLIFVDGFDDGLQSFKWTSYNGSTTGRSGSGMSLSTGNVFTSKFSFNSPDESATIIYGAAYKVAGAQQSAIVYFKSDNIATYHLTIATNTAKGIDVFRGQFGTLLGSSVSNVIVPGGFQYIEVKATLSDTVGAVVVKVDGVTVVNLATQDTKNAGTKTVFDGLEFNQNFASFAAVWDDMYVCNNAGSVNNDFLGDCSVQTIYPDGNGNSSQWVGSDADSVNNYLLVDENGAPNTSDYVESGTATNIDTYTFGNVTGTPDSIIGVVSRVHAAKSDAGAQLMRQTARIGGVNYPHGTDISLSTSYTGYARFMETSPATSVAWTQSEIDGAEFGVEAR